MVAYLTARGPETPFSAPSHGVAFQASTVALGGGGYVTVWLDTGLGAVVGTRFDAAGAEVETFTVSGPDGGGVTAAAALSTGGFVVAYYVGETVYAQRYAADGTKAGGAIATVPAGYYDTYSAPAVVGLPGGGFAVASGHAGVIEVAVVDAGGTLARRATLDFGDDAGDPALVANGGGFAVISSGPEAGANDPAGGLIGQQFDRTGIPVGAPFGVNTHIDGAQYSADAATFRDGTSIVCWTENSATGGIRAQRFAADGTKLGGEIAVSTLAPNDQSFPKVAATAWGGFLVTWMDSGRGPADFTTPSIRAQLFDAAGARLGDEFQVNAAPDRDEQYVEVAIVGNTAVFTWTANADESSLWQRVFDLPIAGTGRDDVLTGTLGADVILGFGGADRINGRAGADTIDGGSGKDVMTGGPGDDRYIVDDRRDMVIERAHGGRDTVESSVDYRLLDGVENLVLTGSFSVAGFGNDKANVITGNSGYNGLFGLASNDVIDGGAGDDRVDGGTGIDRLTGGAGSDLFFFRDGDTGATIGQADRILDFSQSDHDHIDLRGIDAGNARGAFVFIGEDAFSGTAGELRFQITRAGETWVFGDTNGDGHADVALRLSGAIELTAADFKL